MSKVEVVNLESPETGLAFPSLEILRFKDMEGWKVWSTNSGAYPCLQELCIEDCPNLVQVSLEALPSLRVLKLKKCCNSVLRSLVDVASSLTKLAITDILGLTDELWKGVKKYLRTVEDVKIEHCNEMRYVWESEEKASGVLLNLIKLEVYNCSNLVSLGKKEDDNCWSSLTSLRSLGVQSCNRLKQCRCPNSLDWLKVGGCNSLTSVSFPSGGQKLKSLHIVDCKKILEKELGGGEKTRVVINLTMMMLEDVIIISFPNLKSINELSCFIHLTRLGIVACPRMESFPDHELPNLASLKSLGIGVCPNMDASVPRGLWPPKLEFLQVGGLKKPISEWGPQNFPTSLLHLTLIGGRYDDMTNFDRLSHIFPSSLTYRTLSVFEKVESVSKGLQHLNSLQHLKISRCLNIMHLPEMLLPSLLSFTIEECPNLKKKISRGGSYSSLVSRIPHVSTD